MNENELKDPKGHLQIVGYEKSSILCEYCTFHKKHITRLFTASKSFHNPFSVPKTIEKPGSDHPKQPGFEVPNGSKWYQKQTKTCFFEGPRLQVYPSKTTTHSVPNGPNEVLDPTLRTLGCRRLLQASKKRKIPENRPGC